MGFALLLLAVGFCRAAVTAELCREPTRQASACPRRPRWPAARGAVQIRQGDIADCHRLRRLATPESRGRGAAYSMVRDSERSFSAAAGAKSARVGWQSQHADD